MPPPTLALVLCLASWAAPGLGMRTVAQQPAAPAAPPPPQQKAAPGSPSFAVQEFYRLMRERRFREAFALSIFAPALEGLSAAEYEDLKPDFERQAGEVPEQVALTGEQMSGDDATVFMKLGTDEAPQVVPLPLIRERGAWLFGDREGQKLVKKQGKKYFFEARMAAHQDDAENMLRRISTAQIIYSAQNGGLFGNLQQLVRSALIPADVLSTASTGYHFHVETAPGGKSYTGGAEPARYGRTGRLSFYIDPSGLKKDDKGGKPLKGN
ncbi:MAG TPA: hypothetical protein VF240_08015 [Pyrinomonadaceae bacterium]